MPLLTVDNYETVFKVLSKYLNDKYSIFAIKEFCRYYEDNEILDLGSLLIELNEQWIELNLKDTLNVCTNYTLNIRSFNEEIFIKDWSLNNNNQELTIKEIIYEVSKNSNYEILYINSNNRFLVRKKHK